MHTLLQRGHMTCDHRVLGRTLTIAAATLLSLSAIVTSARAETLELVIDHDLSQIDLAIVVDASSLSPQAGNLMATAQAPGSLSAKYTGSILVDLQPGTIQLMPGSSIVPDTTGNYQPLDDGTGTPIFGGTTPGNYGIRLALIGVWAVLHGLESDFGAPDTFDGVPPGGIPSTPMALVGNNFDLTGQAMSFVAGRRSIISIAGNTSESFVGFPTIFGTNGNAIGTWDGTTLTIPVFTQFEEFINEDPDVYQTTILSGQIVAHLIPEPSSLVMAGMGVVGLAFAGYRARRRKA